MMSAQNIPASRKSFTLRKRTHFMDIVSPVERWADDIYAPLPLDYVWYATPKTMQIIARLKQIDPQHFSVELLHGRIVLLLKQASVTGLPVQEYYSEVPLPSNVKQHVVRVSIANDFVTISFDRKMPSFVQRFKYQLTRWKSELVLLSGKPGSLGILNDLDN